MYVFVDKKCNLSIQITESFAEISSNALDFKLAQHYIKRKINVWELAKGRRKISI